MSREGKVNALVARTTAIENGLRVPANPPRYVALEQDMFGNTIWAYFEETLDEVKQALEDSDTSHVDRIRIYDVDTGQQYLPIWKITDLVDLDDL